MRHIKISSFTLLMLLSAASVSAQKTVTTTSSTTVARIQETQARVLDVQSSAYVMPLTVELDVTSERICDVFELTKKQAEVELSGDMSNIRSWAVYMSSKKHDADVIVAATFNIKTNDAADGYEVEVIGFPAKYKNWKSATPEDYEWIRTEKVVTTNEKEKISAVIK